MFRIELNTDNAAFEDKYEEVAAILYAIANRLSSTTCDREDIALRDSNGNTVGYAAFEDK